MLLTFFSFLFFSTVVVAQNPITPPGMYIADPEAHVWKDGRLYLYGSRDEKDDYWCSYSHHVFSTSDLIHWDIDENSISSKGKNDQIDYHDRLLFAPDCAYKNETYYLYYCSPRKLTEGVATSKSPYGPFTGGKQIKGPKQIDPAVLVDKDGEAYYLWGQQHPKMAKLLPNMVEIDTTSIVKPLDIPGSKAFHEGSSIRRIGNKYYLIFADESREKRPTCLGYAIADNPMGPYTYKGVIIDNIGSDPAVWNNHGSIEKFKEQWYVFYHRPTNNSQKFRKACVEPIFINKDGTINEVEMTSQGAGPPLVATNRIEAERACLLEGNVRISLLPSLDAPNEGLTKIKGGDKVAYKYINFKEGIKEFQVKTVNSNGGEIEIRINNSSKGKVIGRCKILPNTNNTSYQISSCKVKCPKGEYALWLTFKGEKELLFDVDWFRFN